MRYFRFSIALVLIVGVSCYMIAGSGLTKLDDDLCEADVSSSIEALLEEFKEDNEGRYMPHDVALGGLECQFFLYFLRDTTGKATQLHFYIQYCADDPLRYREMFFIIDGTAHHFVPAMSDLKRLKGRYYMETSDTRLQEADDALLDSLLECRELTIKLCGIDGMGHVIPLHSWQREDFVKTIQLYRLMGGKL